MQSDSNTMQLSSYKEFSRALNTFKAETETANKVFKYLPIVITFPVYFRTSLLKEMEIFICLGCYSAHNILWIVRIFYLNKTRF